MIKNLCSENERLQREANQMRNDLNQKATKNTRAMNELVEKYQIAERSLKEILKEKQNLFDELLAYKLVK